MPFDALPDVGLPTEAHILFLRRIERLLSHRSHWTQGYLRTGRWWRRYCVVGALMRVKGKYQFSDMETTAVRHALDAAAKRHGYPTIIALNDDGTTKHPLVISVIREALSHMEFQHAIVTR